MSLETWKSLLELGGVILLFLTFIFGAGVVITTNRINERQAARLRDFDKSLTDAKVELGKQQERAANAESELLKLQQRINDRTLSPEQRARFVATARASSCPIELGVPKNSGEAQRFAELLGSLLREAGWTEVKVLPMSFQPTPEGLMLSHRDKGLMAPCTDSLRKALIEVGHDPKMEYSQNISGGRLSLTVGIKR